MSKKVKVETIPFWVSDFILEVAAKLSIRSGNDILRFEKITKTIESVERERQEIIQGIFAKHEATNEEVIKELEKGKPNPDFNKAKFDLVDGDYKEAFQKGSNVDRKDLQLYTMDEFVSKLPKKKQTEEEKEEGLEPQFDMHPQEITMIKHWLVKEG